MLNFYHFFLHKNHILFHKKRKLVRCAETKLIWFIGANLSLLFLTPHLLRHSDIVVQSCGEHLPCDSDQILLSMIPLLLPPCFYSSSLFSLSFYLSPSSLSLVIICTHVRLSLNNYQFNTVFSPKCQKILQCR